MGAKSSKRGKGEGSVSSRTNWPDIQLMQLNRKGMVFRSHRLFDPGDCLTLGVHLNAGAAGVTNDFLNLKAVVVDCRVVSWGEDSRVFEVTVLFNAVGESEGDVLAGMGTCRRSGDEETAGGFDRILGLN